MSIKINFTRERYIPFQLFSRGDLADRLRKGIFHRRFWSLRKQTLLRLRVGETFLRLDGDRLDAWNWIIWKQRDVSVAGLVADALAHLGVKELPPFLLNTGDRPMTRHRLQYTRFSACSAAGSQDVAAPDFTFGGWPEARYDDFDAKAASIAAASSGPASDNRVGWLGRNNTPSRRIFFALARKRPDLIDARDMMAQYDRQTNLYQGAFVPMEDQAAAYRYLIDLEGSGYSGRLKLFLHARRVMFVQDCPWKEWFAPLMQPYRHYIPVKRDLSDLIERIEWLRERPEVEAEIIREAQLFAHTHLTRAGAVAAWVKLLERHIAADGRLMSGLENESQRSELPSK